MVASKIEYAVSAPREFIRLLHQEGTDRGMICTFGNTFRVEQAFTSTEAVLDRSLAAVADGVRRSSGEGTRMYDSMADAVEVFWQHADRSRPWVMITVTDGMDNRSLKYNGNPVAVGAFLAERFNYEPTNYLFLIGVGNGREIDTKALAAVGEHGGFPALRIDAFPLLSQVFATLAMQVSRGLQETVLQGPGFLAREVRPMLRVARQPIDYAFLIDRSGSMAASAA
jgi:Mg-chelatase subunit ChlD